MTTAFVLSGGASLGAIQVGMLQALLRRGARDFSHTAALIERAQHWTTAWLESGSYRDAAWPLSSRSHSAAA